MARTFVVVVCVLYGIGNVAYSISTWQLPDIDAYWNAAMRLREGAPLYVVHPDVNAAEVYRYAPWFAWAWVPITHLPRHVVDVGWAITLIVASLAVALPVMWHGSAAAVALGSLVGSFLILSASHGNVQPLVVAALYHTAGRRSGPLAIALASSLKASPILYVLVHLGRREWLKAAISIAVAGLLVLPMLRAMTTGVYTTDPGQSASLYGISPWIFVLVAGASVLTAAYVAWRQPRHAWLAASIAVILCLPRYFPYELTYLLVGLRAPLPYIAASPGDTDSASRVL